MDGIPTDISEMAAADLARRVKRGEEDFAGKSRYLQYTRAYGVLKRQQTPGALTPEKPRRSPPPPFISTPDLEPPPKKRKIADNSPAAPIGWNRANLSDEVRRRLRQGSRDFNES